MPVRSLLAALLAAALAGHFVTCANPPETALPREVPVPARRTPAPARPAAGGEALMMTVRETAGVARTGEVVRSGLPLPRALDVRDPARLTVVDERGRPVPAELRVLARWNAGRDDAAAPIQWLLAAFPVTVGARERASYRLVTDGSAGPNPPPPQPLRLARRGDEVTVDTGAAVFRLGAEPGALFDELSLAGPPGSGAARVAGGGAMTVESGGRVHGHSRKRRLEVVHAGPLTAVVVLEGAYDLPPVGGGGLASRRRYVFTAGSPAALVRQSVAWEGTLNPGCNGCLDHQGSPNGVLVGRWRDTLALDLEAPLAVTAASAAGEPVLRGAVARGEEAWVRQLRRADRKAPLRFEVRAGRSSAAGKKADGAVLAAAAGRGAVAIALDHMHRYEPQALRLLPDGRLALDLADDGVWLAHHQGLFANLAVAALPAGEGATAPARDDLARLVWAPLNRPLRAWPDAAWFARSGAVDDFPAGELPPALADYDRVVKGVLQATVEGVDREGLGGLATFGLYPSYWGRWKSPELECGRHDPTPSERWDDIFWCAPWTDYHNTLATAPIWAMRSGEVEWLDEIAFPGALRMLHTQVMQCAPGDDWFYCGQSPSGYGAYRTDFNSSHAYFENLFLYYWLTGDETVPETLTRGAENMRRWLCELRGEGRPCPPDHPLRPNTSFVGRVSGQWLAAFRFVGLAADPSFLEDFRSGMARALTHQYAELERGGVRYGFLAIPGEKPGTATTGQLFQIGLFDSRNLERLERDTGDAPLGDPPVRPSAVLAALARSVRDFEVAPGGDWALQRALVWEGSRRGGTLRTAAALERPLYGPEKATTAALLAGAGRATGDAALLAAGREVARAALDASGGEGVPLGKLQGQYLTRVHEAVALLAAPPRPAAGKPEVPAPSPAPPSGER